MQNYLKILSDQSEGGLPRTGYFIPVRVGIGVGAWPEILPSAPHRAGPGPGDLKSAETLIKRIYWYLCVFRVWPQPGPGPGT